LRNNAVSEGKRYSQASGAFRGIIFQSANVNYGRLLKPIDRPLETWPKRSSPEIFRSLSKGRRRNTAPLRTPSLQWGGPQRARRERQVYSVGPLRDYAERVFCLCTFISRTHARRTGDSPLRKLLASKIFRYGRWKSNEEVVRSSQFPTFASGKIISVPPIDITVSYYRVVKSHSRDISC